MPTFSHLPSGKWRVQVRRAGIYPPAAFSKKPEAKDPAAGLEAQAGDIGGSGYGAVPKGATLEDLIDKYVETVAKTPGKTKEATLAMLKAKLGKVKLSALSAVVLRDFIDRRMEDG